MCAHSDAKKLGPPEWNQLLVDAVAKPGVISQAYSRFWNYSVGNQILAIFQCFQRNLEPGPIHTFQGWKELGRSVRRGERAITLCMPVKVKRKVDPNKIDPEDLRTGDGAEQQLATSSPGTKTVTVFTYKPHWFVLAQTEGKDYQPTDLPEWNEGRALASLLIDRIPFDHPNGNCQGFAMARNVSVSPIAILPHKTLFHELAHVLLGHTEALGKLDDHDHTPVNLREVEAECVALICCESLGLAGSEFCRGYIQPWLGTESIPDRSAQKIFKAADAILKAGRPASEDPPTAAL